MPCRVLVALAGALLLADASAGQTILPVNAKGSYR